ncbi:MAG: hypothetical protein ACI4VF_08100, partial [Lachnospirales bacterium]
MKYATVVVSNGHEKVNHTFQYIIPENLKYNIKEGMRVKVPFGKGNRNIEAYVIGFSDKAEVREDKLKCISSLLEKYPIITDKRLELCKWMEKKYYTTLSNCIGCIVPKFVKEKQFACIELNKDNPDIDKIVDKILSKNTKQKKILEVLLGGDIVPVSHIKTLLGVDSQPIKALSDKGAIIYHYYQEYRGNYVLNNDEKSKKP